MGSCSSKHKKGAQQSSNSEKKTLIKVYSNTKENNKKSDIMQKRTSVLLQNIDRISNQTICDDITKFYFMDTNNQLANGSFGIIRKAIEIGTNKEYAVKMISKTPPPGMPQEMLRILLKNEVEICLQLKHDNVIKCEKVFEDMIAVYFVFELIDGGDLFNFIQTFPNRKIPENKVIELFIQILESLHYIHQEKDIVHKDIKPENFLVYTEGSKLNVKLIDFGFAEKLDSPGQKLRIEAGSLPYISPEMLNHEGYDTKHDMFSIGVVLFNMLTGKQPFFGKDEEERKTAILKSDPNFPKDMMNAKLRDLLSRLMEKDPEKRLTVQDAKLHPWIQEYIALHEQQTVKKEFIPNINNSQNLTNLVKITNIKNMVWNNLLTYLNLDIAYEIRKHLIDNYSEYANNNNQSIQGKFSINYDIFLETVILIARQHDKINLVNKLEEILSQNRNMCKEHMINYIDLIDFFLKSRSILIKEKIWNYYKKIEETDPTKNIKLSEILDYLKSGLNENQINEIFEIANEKSFDLNSNLSYEQMGSVWQEYETRIILRHNKTGFY